MSNKQNTPDPFGFFRAEPFGWTDCAETYEGAQPLFDQVAIDAISKQRDELLAALLRVVSDPYFDQLDPEAQYYAEEAIVSVKGGAE